MSEILPPRRAKTTTLISVRLSTELVEDLAEVSRDTGYSRAGVIERFLRFALEQHNAQIGKARGK